MKRFRVLIGDGDSIDLARTEKLLATEFEVIDVEQDGRTLVFTAMRMQPDAVVLSISMRSLSGIEAVREIRAAVPQVRVILFTVHSESLFKLEALRAGASAYVSKQAPDQLIGAIHAALNRDTKDMAVVDNGSQQPAGPIGFLTQRQREVLQLVAQGCALKEIAAILGISPKTVEFHKYRLMAQLRVSSTAELIAAAFRLSLVSVKTDNGDGDSPPYRTRKTPHHYS